MHNTESPAFTDNEQENQGNKTPTRREDPLKQKVFGVEFRIIYVSRSGPPALEKKKITHFSTEARLYHQRPDK